MDGNKISLDTSLYNILSFEKAKHNFHIYCHCVLILSCNMNSELETCTDPDVSPMTKPSGPGKSQSSPDPIGHQ